MTVTVEISPAQMEIPRAQRNAHIARTEPTYAAQPCAQAPGQGSLRANALAHKSNGPDRMVDTWSTTRITRDLTCTPLRRVRYDELRTHRAA